MNVLLQPASGREAVKHFADTVNEGVSSSIILNNLDKSSVVPNLLHRQKVWGIVPTIDGRSRSEWNRLQNGDFTLFYFGGKFRFLARVSGKLHSPVLADALWGKDDTGRTWEYIYFIDEGKLLDLAFEPSVIGYKQNYILRGATLPSGEKATAMLNYIERDGGGLLDPEVIEPSDRSERIVNERAYRLRTPQEAEEQIKALSKETEKYEVKERVRIAKSLSQNPRFSRLVKEKAAYICEVCQAKPFIQKSGLPYAEAHHLNELSVARLDSPHEMICVCPTCHRVLHYGSDESLKERNDSKSILATKLQNNTRVAPVGMFRYAMVFMRTYRDIMINRKCIDEEVYPVNYYLLGHALELSMKSLLLIAGVTANKLKFKYKHSLAKLLSEVCDTYKIGLSRQEVAAIHKLDFVYRTKDLEYFTRGFKSLPDCEDIYNVTLRILSECESEVAKTIEGEKIS